MKKITQNLNKAFALLGLIFMVNFTASATILTVYNHFNNEPIAFTSYCDNRPTQERLDDGGVWSRTTGFCRSLKVLNAKGVNSGKKYLFKQSDGKILDQVAIGEGSINAPLGLGALGTWAVYLEPALE